MSSELYKVVSNDDDYHQLPIGCIVRWVHGHAYEIVSDIDDDFLHDCDGLVPSGLGHWLLDEHVEEYHEVEEDMEDLYV